MAHHRGAAGPVIDRILASGSSPKQNKSATQQSTSQIGEGGPGRGKKPQAYESYVDNSVNAGGPDKRTTKTPIISFDQFMESHINRDPKEPSGSPGERIFSRSMTSRLRSPTAPGDQTSSTRCPPSCAQSSPSNKAGGSYDTQNWLQGSQRSRPKESEYQVNVGTHVAVTGGPAVDFRGRSTKSSPVGLVEKTVAPSRFASQGNARRQDGAPSQGQDLTSMGGGGAQKGRTKRHIDFDLPAVSKKDGASLSLIQRFDRAVTNELNSRQLAATPQGIATLNETLNSKNRRPPVEPSLAMSLRSTVSGAEIEHILYGDQDMMFHDAVDKLVQAEETCMYAGAVKAAEEAAARAPPELAEEAAAAGARTYRAKLVQSVHESLPAPIKGCKPIEVIGYIGITRPYDKTA